MIAGKKTSMPLQLVEGSTGEDQLMDSIDVDYTAEGWLIIDVTKAVKSWQLDYHANQGKVCYHYITPVRKRN